MNDDTTNHDRTPAAIEDMLADLELTGAEAEGLRALLGDVAGLASEVPEPSQNVRALLGGAVPLRSRRRLAAVAAVAGALALGGVSAAAAANRLPSHVQEVVADATGGVVPHPVKPTDPPNDAPGRDKPDQPDRPTNAPDDAPGQIQKSTKPDPSDPGPARPADPGSHGRAHNEANDRGAEQFEDDDDDEDGPGRRANDKSD